MISNTEKRQLQALVKRLSYDRGKMGRQRSKKEDLLILRRKLWRCETTIVELISRQARRKLRKSLCKRYLVESFGEGAKIHTAPNGFKLILFEDKESLRNAHHLGLSACRSGYHFDSNPFVILDRDIWADFARKWYRGYLNQWRSEIMLVATFDRFKEERQFSDNVMIPKGKVGYRYIVNDDFKYTRIHPVSFKAYDWDLECWFEYWGPEEDEFGRIPHLD